RGRHDPKKQILIGLWYFANQESYRQISDRFDVSLGSSITIINCMVDKICENADRFIIWPKGNKLNDTIEGFTSLRTNAFPKVVGAIDGAHIKILAPWTKRNKMPPLDRNSYINRKQVATVLLQGICDSEYKFINIFSGWPGSAHDAHVFKNSPVGEQLISNSLNLFPRDMHILGDCAYPLLHCLMTPYRDNGHLTKEQRHFNYKLSSSRIVIEQNFLMSTTRLSVPNVLQHVYVYIIFVWIDQMIGAIMMLTHLIQYQMTKTHVQML
ncbi:putative nuclease HARBI1, partial [Acyrthosiphon pisum]|uniref:DDE Tnp4 domain-containing protein n=1 Tax=Acyrthosiphon pisum TaxID=7029 RepID=A0A8R2FCZ0_ACYPI